MTTQRSKRNAALVGRLSQGAMWGLLVVVVAMAIGMTGYMWWGQMGLAQAFANAAMILSGMGPLDKLESTGGLVFEGVYALVCGLVFFAVAGLILSPLLHHLLHSFHLEDTDKNS